MLSYFVIYYSTSSTTQLQANVTRSLFLHILAVIRPGRVSSRKQRNVRGMQNPQVQYSAVSALTLDHATWSFFKGQARHRSAAESLQLLHHMSHSLNSLCPHSIIRNLDEPCIVPHIPPVRSLDYGSCLPHTPKPCAVLPRKESPSRKKRAPQIHQEGRYCTLNAVRASPSRKKRSPRIHQEGRYCMLNAVRASPSKKGFDRHGSIKTEYTVR